MIQGLFGGTFNPIHRGHLEVICHVKKEFLLDRIFLIPSAIPPHKPSINLAPANDRFEMVKQSIADIKGLVASDVELRRQGPSFTIDTVNHFKKNLLPQTDLRLIVGSDAFFEMHTWEQGIDLFSLISTIVMIRPGEKKQAKDVASFLQHMISKGYTPANGKNLFSDPALKPVYVCRVPEVNISSTIIRQRVKHHLPVAAYLPRPVENIITQKGLYL